MTKQVGLTMSVKKEGVANTPAVNTAVKLFMQVKAMEKKLHKALALLSSAEHSEWYRRVK